MPGSISAASTTRPGEANFTALLIRFVRIWRMRTRSASKRSGALAAMASASVYAARRSLIGEHVEHALQQRRQREHLGPQRELAGLHLRHFQDVVQQTE